MGNPDQQCIHCGGSGHCKACGGAGEIAPIVAASDSRMPFMVPCSACNGSGKCLGCQWDWQDARATQANYWIAAWKTGYRPPSSPVVRPLAKLVGFNQNFSRFSLQRLLASITLIAVAGGLAGLLPTLQFPDSFIVPASILWGSFLGVGVGFLWKRPVLGAVIGLMLTWIMLLTKSF